MRVDSTYTGDDGEQRWEVDLTNEEYESIRKLLDAEMEYHTNDRGGTQFEVGESDGDR